MVVGADDKVELRVLTTERAIGTDWLVSKGLSDGDRIIVKGVQKVKPGAEVTAKKVEPGAPQDGTPAAPPPAG